MLELYRHRRLVITLALLYLSQGIPIGLAMDALPTLLRQDGAPLQALAFLPLVGLPWVVKFLWAPWVDNHWSRRLGRRRSWILPMQCIVLACLLGLATLVLGVASAGWAVACWRWLHWPARPRTSPPTAWRRSTSAASCWPRSTRYRSPG